MRKSLLLSVSLLCTLVLCACSRLSGEAKKIVGTYYNTELSETEPVMELHRDAKCVIRAIKPGVLTYSVEGTWNVKNDSLIVTLDPSTLKSEGDKTLIGKIPERFAQKVAGYNEFSLQLENNGITYFYKRRTE